MATNVKNKVLHTAAKLFISQGYEKTSLRLLSKESGVNYGSITNAFESKENILCELVEFVLEGQFETTSKLLKDITNDKILFYGAETVLQLHMAESSEHIREMYNVSYSLPKTSEIIYKSITKKFQYIFSDHLKDYDTKDFYYVELASAGIIRNYMSKPCDMFFTMDMKIENFLEKSLLLFRVSDEKIKEVIKFVKSFDFKSIADETINNMLGYLQYRIDE